MGISNWKFIKPVYAGQMTNAEVTVLSMKPVQEMAGNAVTWLFEFKDEKGEMVQLLQVEIMHKS